jgi:hypothetical protein
VFLPPCEIYIDSCHEDGFLNLTNPLLDFLERYKRDEISSPATYLPQSNPSSIPLTIVNKYYSKMRATAFLVTVFASLCLAHPFADASGDECPPMVVSTTALWVLWKTVSGVVINMGIQRRPVRELRAVHMRRMAVFTADRIAKLGRVDATIRSSNARW